MLAQHGWNSEESLIYTKHSAEKFNNAELRWITVTSEGLLLYKLTVPYYSLLKHICSHVWELMRKDSRERTSGLYIPKQSWQWPCLSGAAMWSHPVTVHLSNATAGWDVERERVSSAGKSGTECGYEWGIVLSKKHREQYPFVSGVPNKVQVVPRHLWPLMSTLPKFDWDCLTWDAYRGLCCWDTCTGPGRS